MFFVIDEDQLEPTLELANGLGYKVQNAGRIQKQPKIEVNMPGFDLDLKRTY